MHRFTEEAAALVAESRRLFRVAYEHHYPKAVRGHIDAIRKFSRDAIDTTTNLKVNAGGQKITVGDQQIGNGNYGRWIPECEKLPVLHDLQKWQGCVAYGPEDPATAQFQEFARRRKDFGEMVETAYNEAFGTLGQFATGKKLAADWPEAMPVIGHLIPEDNRMLPVVQVSKLNASFKLPPK